MWADALETPSLTFTEEESWVSGDRGFVRWQYSWAGDEPGHVRGVDVLRLRDGLLAEKFSYVKGWTALSPFGPSTCWRDDDLNTPRERSAELHAKIDLLAKVRATYV